MDMNLSCRELREQDRQASEIVLLFKVGSPRRKQTLQPINILKCNAILLIRFKRQLRNDILTDIFCTPETLSHATLIAKYQRLIP